MNKQLKNPKSLSYAVSQAISDVAVLTSDEALSLWIDGQLAELEEKHANYMTRDSLARHFGATKGRGR